MIDNSTVFIDQNVKPFLCQNNFCTCFCSILTECLYLLLYNMYSFYVHSHTRSYIYQLIGDFSIGILYEPKLRGE